MNRATRAYIAGLAAGGCVVKGLRPYISMWLRDLGFRVEGDMAELPEEFCRYKPTALLEHVYFLKGVFEAHGELFLADPHGGDVVLIIRLWDRRVRNSLSLLGIRPLETTDERGQSRFTVVYRRRDVARFIKFVKPVIDDMAIAERLGLCTPRRS